MNPALDGAAIEAAALRRLRAKSAKAPKPERAPKAAAPPVLTVATDPEPWPDPVSGVELFNEIVTWISGYVWLPERIVHAVVLWIVATWYVDVIDIAPLLLLLSATKRCAKSLLLDLVYRVSRRGYLTSGTGITTAVVFRLNEQRQPTLAIDEAEKLAGRHADRDLIGMLNAGYRRGAKVQRCVESKGDYVIREFNAFGFRALAAIGTLWNTITDRGITIPLERKPQGASVRRFSSRELAVEGAAYARQLRRWADGTMTEVEDALQTVPRPAWLNDRSADNWAALFAVAMVAGEPWLERALAVAEVLEAQADERDHAELLVHDLWRLWNVEQWTDAVPSGTVVEQLVTIETSPWGGYRDGKGITTHGLAALLRPLGIRPRQARNAQNDVVRGYWLADLKPLYQRYPAPGEVVQVVQALLLADSKDLVVPCTSVPVVPHRAKDEGAIAAESKRIADLIDAEVRAGGAA